MNNTVQNKKFRMTKAEIDRAKLVLAQRNEKTRLDGFEAEWCDTDFGNYYHPRSPYGYQIYRSYTSDELLDILITVMAHHGHSPQFDKLHHVYKLYLSWRFGNLSIAKEKARARYKMLQQQNKWPPDWRERVDSAPFYKWMEEHGRAANDEDKTVIENICVQARETGLPPDLSSPDCLYLNKLCHMKKALEMMNIPTLRKKEVRFMTRYWQENKGE